jgi:hypothetical protein
MFHTTPTELSPDNAGTKDGHGAGDHDQPYVFGRRPQALAPFPFTTLEYARLLVLRSRVRDQEV